MGTSTQKAAPAAKKPGIVVMSEEPVRKYIKKRIADKYGTLTAFAEKMEVSLQYVSNVMSGNKPIPDWMLQHFRVGVERTTKYTMPAH